MTLRATATSYSAIADRYARGAGVSARRRHRPDGVPPPGHARALRAARVRRRARSARPVFRNVEVREVRSVALDGGQRDRARGDAGIRTILFDRDTSERLMDHLEALLKGMVADPGEPYRGSQIGR